MADLGDLKARLTLEINRDDLADTLAAGVTTAISGAIETYRSERFYFNELRTTSVTVMGNQYVTLPSGLRIIDQLFVTIGAVNYPLSKREMVDLERLYSVPIVGQPTDYAVIGSTARLWPTPNLAYPLIWLLVADVTPAIDYTDDTSSNSWTNEGAELIATEAKLRLYRDVLSAQATDPRLQLAMAARDQAYSQLKGETNRRISTGRLKPAW